MDELEKLNAERARINNRIWAIEGKRRAAEHANFLGKCFKYRNSYSCPQGDKDRWWLYAKVISVDARGEVKAFQFQTDKYGKLAIEASYRITHSLGGYIPITAGEFNKAWRAVQKRVAGWQP
jgi:hypothetical protein